jgi:hypothetical protein
LIVSLSEKTNSISTLMDKFGHVVGLAILVLAGALSLNVNISGEQPFPIILKTLIRFFTTPSNQLSGPLGTKKNLYNLGGMDRKIRSPVSLLATNIVGLDKEILIKVTFVICLIIRSSLGRHRTFFSTSPFHL